MNIKKICYIVFAAISIIGCSNGDNQFTSLEEDYDKDKKNIDFFLNNNYYDASLDVFTTEAPSVDQPLLVNDENLMKITVEANGVAYDMYTYETVEGKDVAPDGNDIVNVTFEVFDLQNESINVQRENDSFVNLNTGLIGFKNGLPNFKGGFVNATDIMSPRAYKDTGKGFIILPRGLTISGNITNPVEASATYYKVNLRSVTKVANEEEEETLEN